MQLAQLSLEDRPPRQTDDRIRKRQVLTRVGHIAPEFGRLANVLLGRGCGNPALITYPR